MAEEEKDVKQIRICPFSQKPCIEDKCVLFIEMGIAKGGIPVKEKMCAFVAMLPAILSPKPQMRSIQMQGPGMPPGIFRG